MLHAILLCVITSPFLRYIAVYLPVWGIPSCSASLAQHLGKHSPLAKGYFPRKVMYFRRPRRNLNAPVPFCDVAADFFKRLNVPWILHGSTYPYVWDKHTESDIQRDPVLARVTFFYYSTFVCSLQHHSPAQCAPKCVSSIL